MIFKIINEEILQKKEITLEQFCILESLFYKEYTPLEEYLFKVKNRKEILQNLIRRGFIDIYEEEQGTDLIHNIFITEKGEEVANGMQTVYQKIKETESSEVPLSSFEKQFEEFWDTFPTTDKYLGFDRTRVLRGNQSACKKSYKKVLSEYSHEDVIKALRYEIRMRERNSINSIKKSYSDFKFMKSSTVWLNQKEFLIYMELIKEDTEKSQDTFSTDV